MQNYIGILYLLFGNLIMIEHFFCNQIYKQLIVKMSIKGVLDSFIFTLFVKACVKVVQRTNCVSVTIQVWDCF